MKRIDPMYEPADAKTSETEGEDDIYCVLDPKKVCDNCFRCLDSDTDYATVEIDGIYLDGERLY